MQKKVLVFIKLKLTLKRAICWRSWRHIRHMLSVFYSTNADNKSRAYFH